MNKHTLKAFVATVGLLPFLAIAAVLIIASPIVLMWGVGFVIEFLVKLSPFHV